MKKSRAGIKSYLPFILVTFAVFTAASILFAAGFKNTGPVPFFAGFCIIQCTAFLFFAVLPESLKPVPRHASKFLIGMTLLVLAGILGRQNFQIEGFFYLVLAGFFGGAVLHFCMKVIGTIFTGRSWCAWGCWTAALLDLLPYNKNTQWKGIKAKHLRYLHFIASFALVAAVFYGFTFIMQSTNPDQMQNWKESATAVYWVIGGNALYYASGIILALILKDNRAFCKYLCPVAVLLKGAARFSITRIAPVKSNCAACKKCEKSCLSSIAIYDYVKEGSRITSTECIMCLNCIAVCPEGNLRTTTGIDIAAKEYLKS